MLLRTLCSDFARRCLLNPACSMLNRSLSSSGTGGGGAGSSHPTHWDRSTDSGVTSDESSSSALTPESAAAPKGVALATHMLLNQPTYNVMGDIVPVNEYHLTEETPAGVPYHTLPIVYFGARRNNCIVTITDCLGRPLAVTSTGIEGFHNAKKSTTVAAQVVGVSTALKAKKLGISHARVVIRGMNQLRLACLKGMSSGGLQIVSLTDNTKIHYGKGRRPRKPPRK
ncbi:hypothetical protein BOX15_Mlig034396g3 [Macrostomum lignano]|uniref:Uncharacterized protein n=2 Tax=Macrostomum lignano TaxID=282301 RepID=A0A267E3G7_9PLAT|nr:hypothetical protein BOX15_Mlig034396g3 [Macrostomum lignano]